MEEIEPILSHYPFDCRATAVESLGNAGGLSGARFWRLVAPRGTLALRSWPIEQPTPERLEFIHGVVRHAAARGIGYLPVPIANANGLSFVKYAGCLWELAPWLPGTADYDQSPRPEKLRAAMEALARFHVAVADFPIAASQRLAVAPPAITSRLTRLQELQAAGITTLARSISDTTWPDLVPIARQFVTELPRVIPIAIAQLAPLANTPLPLQVCVRDVWHDHVLFTGDTVTGLIDFGAVEVDTPATDVARLLGSLVGNDATGWETGLAAYSAIRPSSESEMRAVAALDTAGTVLALVNWIRWIYIDKRDFDDPHSIIGRIAKFTARVGHIGRRAHPAG